MLSNRPAHTDPHAAWLGYVAAQAAVDYSTERIQTEIDLVPPSWRRAATVDWYRQLQQHRSMLKDCRRRLDSARNEVAGSGAGSSGPGPSPLHLVGGHSLESALDHLLSSRRFTNVDLTERIRAFRVGVEGFRLQRCASSVFDGGASEQGTLVADLCALHADLVEHHEGHAAPLRLFMPEDVRPRHHRINTLCHHYNQSPAALPYKLLATCDDELDPHAYIDFADIFVSGDEGRGLGTAVLSDLTAQADYHRLPIRAMFAPARFGPTDEVDRHPRASTWYRSHGFVRPRSDDGTAFVHGEQMIRYPS